MKKITNTLILLAFIALGIFAYMQYKKKQKTIKVAEVIYEYITDTIYMEKYITFKPDSTAILTPPEEVIVYRQPEIEPSLLEYPADTSWLSSGITYIDSLSNNVLTFAEDINWGIERPMKFITYESWAPKLIGLEVTKDHLHLTVLDTTAQLYTLKWPTNYDYYDYHYAKRGLYRKRTDYVEHVKIDWKALYVNADYDFINNRPSIFLDYNVDINRIRFGSEVRAIARDIEPMEFRIKIGYRLFK